MRYSLFAVLMAGAIVLACSDSSSPPVEKSYGVNVRFGFAATTLVDSEAMVLADIGAVEQYLLELDDDVYLVSADSLPPIFYATWSSSEDQPCAKVVADLEARAYVREVECQEVDPPAPTEPASERVAQPQFLNPIAEAQETGLTPYWLGGEFSAGDEVFLVNRQTGFHSAAQGGPSVFLSYEARRGLLTLQTLAETASLDEELRSGFDGEPAVTMDRVVIGRWRADMYTIAAELSPVSQLVLFLDVDGTTLVATTTTAGSYYIPGEDPNPLMDSRVLIETLERLRPYPE